MSFHPSVSRWTLALAVLTIAAGVLGVRLGVAAASDRAIGSITYLTGTARCARHGGKRVPLHTGSKLFEGDRLETLAGARLEATLSDGSKLRLGERSELDLQRVTVAKKERRREVTVKLLLGRAWATVSKLFGGHSSFEVTTASAVAGVRGTRFATEVSAAGDTTVKVYSGKVLVSNKPIYAIEGHTKSKRVQVAGPQEISRKQWEELVAGALQMVRISSGGRMSAAAGFALSDPAQDDWEAWNAERDGLAAAEQ